MSGSSERNRGRKNSRKGRLTSASDVLQGLLQNSGTKLGQSFTRWRLWHNWDQVVGPSVASHTDPVGYSNGILYVWVENSVRLQEVSFLASQLIRNINTHVGRKWVRRIRFTLDRKSVPKHEEMSKGLRDFLSKQPPNEGGEPQPGQ